MKINVKTTDSKYIYDFDDCYWRCDHKFVYEEACCSTRGSSGYYECGCGGMDSVLCERDDCTDEYEVDKVLEELGYIDYGGAEW